MSPEASAMVSSVALASAVGAHALPLFLVLLAALMVVAGAVCGGLQWRRERRTETPAAEVAGPRRLVLALVAGGAAIVGTAGLFVAIAGRLDPVHSMGAADQALADAIARHTPPAALNVFASVTHLGDPPILAVLGALVAIALWCVRERLLAIGWALALAGNALLNPLLKDVFERVRPVHADGLAQATGYSFPSGHSSGAMVAYAMLLYVGLRVLPPRWHVVATMASVALVCCVACSRIFLRVHFASDVAAGLLSGLCWTGVCVAGLEWARHVRARRQST